MSTIIFLYIVFAITFAVYRYGIVHHLNRLYNELWDSSFYNIILLLGTLEVAPFTAIVALLGYLL